MLVALGEVLKINQKQLVAQVLHKVRYMVLLTVQEHLEALLEILQ